MEFEDFAPAGIVRQRAGIDCARIAEAYRAKRPVARARRAPSIPAASGEPCGYCGISGRLGCEHFAPMEPPAPTVEFRTYPPIVGRQVVR